MTAFPTLLSPLDVGPMTVRNRSVSTAHGAYLDYYRPGVSDAQYLAYQERRARGGCGLIILQALLVHPSAQVAGHYMWERSDLVPKFRRMSDALHDHGTKVTVQLAHFGTQFRSDGNPDLSAMWGFKRMLSPSGWEVGHAMTAEEVEQVIQGYVRTAEVAVEGGLDGVELHATHGYLLQQSFSEWANDRKDEWGEPLRFLEEVMGRVREAIGPDIVMGLRISAEDWIPWSRGGLGADGLRAVAAHACETGMLDYLNHSAGARSAHYAKAIADYYGQPGVFLPLARGLKAVSNGVPVIAVGKITGPSEAEQALAAGDCDLVALTRAQIADPDLITKAERGDADRIRPCVGANSGCVDRMEASLPITCFHNPEVGQEYLLDELTVVDQPKRVLVVGAGPAGLKAAEIAARRGHQVTLVDRATKPGGRLRAVGELGPPASMLGAIDWIVSELGILGVDVELGTEVDAAFLQSHSPDAIVLATGVEGVEFDASSDGSVDVLTIDESMVADVDGKHIVILDQVAYQESAFCAEHLARNGATVTLVTPFPSVGINIGFTHIRGHLERLHAGGVEMLTSTVVTGIADGTVATRQVYAKENGAIQADAIVVAGVRTAALELYEAAREVCDQVLMAGDVVANRQALNAFREGDRVGRAI